MRQVVFEPRPLPSGIGEELLGHLRAAHSDQPLSTADARETVRRVVRITARIGLEATVYRGGLDLRGIEVDHIWLDVDGRVVDAAFPLHAGDFVGVLRAFVAGDATADELETAAASAAVEERVLGVFPAPMRYLGAPVWSSRQ